MPLNFPKKHSKALRFILFIGVVSLFADMTYEGARSIIGGYLGWLGASATIVGIVAGFGELVGYGLRLFSGYFAERTTRYWAITILGYAINLLAVPLLAFSGNWFMASILIIAERAGKGIRIPTRDAMLSHAGHEMGMGLGFGIHEAMDRLGAMLGPLVISVVFYLKGNYREAFAVLAIPAVLALVMLVFVRFSYPNPRDLEIASRAMETRGMPKSFWLYLIGACFVGAGYADFPLIAYHFEKVKALSTTWIPLTYAIAMGVNAVMSLLVGHLYDRRGFWVLIIVTIVSSFFAPMVFIGAPVVGILGVVLWAVGVGSHNSLMRAIVANMVSPEKRASAYGIFNMGYGIFWFLGSAAMGILYDISIPILVAFILLLQFLAIPWLIATLKRITNVSSA